MLLLRKHKIIKIIGLRSHKNDKYEIHESLPCRLLPWSAAAGNNIYYRQGTRRQRRIQKCYAAVETVAPVHSADTKFYVEYLGEHEGSPLKNWLVFEVIGVVIGAFVSGLVSNRLKFTMDVAPGSTKKIRIIGAIIGGVLFGFGSQLARGCTSGSALSGMAVLSAGGIITMMAIFGGAYMFAFFFRKFGIKKGQI